MVTIPTLQALYTAYLNGLQSELQLVGSIPLVGKNFLRALAAVLAAKDKLIYLSLGIVQKNIFIDTADPEALGGTLERFGRIKLGEGPNAARAGKYDITITGTIGGVVPASMTFKSDDGSTSPGKLYILDDAYALVATTDTINVRALEAGSDSTLNVGDTLTATAPMPLVDAGAVVSAETQAAVPAETTEQYRSRALASYRLEPQGGSASDYRLWARDATGVVQAYAYTKANATNEVNVFIKANVNNGVPTSGILLEAAECIEYNPDETLELAERGRRPLGVFMVNVLPVTLREVVITFTNFANRDSGLESLIQSVLDTEVNKIRPYVSGADVYADRNNVLDINKIISAVLAAAPGSSFDSVTFTIDGVAKTSFLFDFGDIPHLNTIVYVG